MNPQVNSRFGEDAMRNLVACLYCLSLLLLAGCADSAGTDSPATNGTTPATTTPAVSKAAPATDIWTAAKQGDVESVKTGLAAGTGVDTRGPNGMNLLWTSAIFGQPEVTKLLLEQGADIETKDEKGNTALLVAAFLGRAKVVEVLLANGAKVNVRNSDGSSPIDSTQADWQTTQGIAQSIGVDVEQGLVQAGRTRVVALLTEKGAKLGGGGGGLLAAVRSQDTEAVKLALSKDADLKARDPQLGITPLNWASLLGNVEIVRILVKKGADINGPNRDGNRPLHTASYLGRTSVVEFLLSKGADANAKNTKGETPLASATTGAEGIGFIAGLLKIQVNVAAAQQGRAKCVELLKQGGAKAAPTGSGELLAAVLKQDVAAVTQLLAKGANPNSQDPQNGVTVLNLAALHGNIAVVKLLIANKADINGPSRDGNRPVHSAAFLGRAAVVELLLSKGADANIKNDKGETPLVSATTGAEFIPLIAGLLMIQVDMAKAVQGRTRCVALLKKAGAK
ncbi:MAG: ankyrin repeat domain-containing protein [Planctomycetaceae bacterium]|nr:ankyrin repeat domain-containing protein [Planctomycetaceae bacterium]